MQLQFYLVCILWENVNKVLGEFIILVIVIAFIKTICSCLSSKNKSIKIRTAQDVKLVVTLKQFANISILYACNVASTVVLRY